MSETLKKPATLHDIERETELLGFQSHDFYEYFWKIAGNATRDLFDFPITKGELYDWTLQARERMEECQTYRDYEDQMTEIHGSY